MLTPMVNDGRHIESIVANTACPKHNAVEDSPCFLIFPGAKSKTVVLLGVCGPRIKRAGYNGTINPLSLRLKTPGGRAGSPKR